MLSVVPAKAGIPYRRSCWIPAFAGMTRRVSRAYAGSFAFAQ
jgi:hypothetical protein